jgi:hypothetical protein
MKITVSGVNPAASLKSGRSGRKRNIIVHRRSPQGTLRKKSLIDLRALVLSGETLHKMASNLMKFHMRCQIAACRYLMKVHEIQSHIFQAEFDV